MPSTTSLKTTITITSRFIYNSPMLYVNSGELAFSIGDWVRQFMLAPPFAWRWNRAEITNIVCVPGQTDYVINIPDFGWLEKAAFFYPPSANQNTPLPSRELTISEPLVQESVLGQPGFISVVGDDNNGNITFRLMMVPDQAYVLYLVYQKAAPKFNSTTDFWTPIPDYFSYLYNLGFLAKAYEYKGDERFAFAHQEFLRLVTAANDGLSDSQKNIFLGPKLISAREQGSVPASQQTRQFRGGA